MTVKLDGLQRGSLDDYHNHRKKNEKYLYFCRTCVHSMASPSPLEECKFCGSSVKKMKAPTKYTYFCASCDYKFDTVEKQDLCVKCNRRCLHLYKWQELSFQEKQGIWIARLLRRVLNKLNGHSVRNAVSLKGGENGISVRSETAPVFNRKKTKKSFSLFTNGNEEMPTF